MNNLNVIHPVTPIHLLYIIILAILDFAKGFFQKFLIHLQMFSRQSLQILFIVNFVFIHKSLVIECNCNTFACSTI